MINTGKISIIIRWIIKRVGLFRKETSDKIVIVDRIEIDVSTSTSTETAYVGNVMIARSKLVYRESTVGLSRPEIAFVQTRISIFKNEEGKSSCATYRTGSDIRYKVEEGCAERIGARCARGRDEEPFERYPCPRACKTRDVGIHGLAVVDVGDTGY